MNSVNSKDPKKERAAAETPIKPITVRVSARLRKILQDEADRRSEDLAATVRRHLADAARKADGDLRFERLERKIDALTGSGGGDSAGLTDAVDAVARASIEMEGRLAELAASVKGTKKELEALKDAYREIVQTLNAFLNKMRQ